MSSSEISDPGSRISRIIESPLIKIAIPLLIVAIGIFVLHELASHVSWSDVKADVLDASPEALLASVAATGLSFVGISFYDMLAVQSIAKGKVPLRVAAVAGACGYAVSNLLGFSYITGTAVRFRIYASLGLDLGLVAGVIATSWVAFWMGLIVISGGLIAFHPAGLSTVVDLSNGVETAIGLALLAAIVVLFIWLAAGKRRLEMFGLGLDLPGFKLSLSLTGASCIDILGAALALYVLMPADLVQSFPYFFVVYIAAISLGLLSHAPAGLGVFEATVIAGMGASGRSDVLAALLLYRLVYTLLPFVLATLGLGGVWIKSNKDSIGSTTNWSYRIAKPIVPMIAAGVSFIAGTTLLISGSLPSDVATLRTLREVLPLSFIEASHLIGSIVGLLLIIIARGLYRKLFLAWLMALGLMGIGLVASLSKGLGLVEATSLTVSFLFLLAFKSAFYRVEGASVFRLNTAWIISVATLLAVTIWIGVFAYSHVDYQSDLWWEFALHGDASRFLRASLVVSIILAAISINSMLHNRGAIAQAQPIPDLVRSLVAASEDADAQISLTGDKAFLIADNSSAFLAYADTGKSLIAKGDPVGDKEAGMKLIWQFREQADKAGRRCAFYSVSPEYIPTYLDLGMSVMKIGEVARVDLTSFSLNGSSKKGFRQAKNRAAREGYVFEVIPAAQVVEILPELRRISDAWLESKQGEEKAFSLGAFADDYNRHFDHAVLRNAETGEIAAFANLFQSGNKNELSLDLMRYNPDGQNFVMDALFAELMLWGSEQGFHWFSLGAAPFSGIENHPLASFWNRVGGFVYEHGEHFYHFEGLRSFKQKFGPVWTPNYLASPGGLAVPRVLYEVNALVSGGIKGLIK
jgi:phosphatidylglycerol lysyltransferase